MRGSNRRRKLAEAQYLIAQELRFDNWAALKRHIAAMTREREAALAQAALPPDARSLLDGDLRTLHIRCGSDLKAPLQNAGFRGDFYEHNYPYLIGPVREGPGCLEQRARFLVESYADSSRSTAPVRSCSARSANAMNSGCTIPQTTTES